MIAKNYLRCAAAMALQMPLPFGRPVWNGSRPTTRTGRAMRSIRAAAIQQAEKLLGRVRYPVKATAPAWWKEARAKARALAQAVRNACLGLAI